MVGQNKIPFAALRISARGAVVSLPCATERSDVVERAAQTPQLAEKNSSLYTWGFPETVQTRSPRGNHGAGRING
jgi:hypothetical protein